MNIENVIIPNLLLLAVIAAFVGDIFVYLVTLYWRKKLYPAGGYHWIARLIGYAERALYVFSWAIGHSEFIAVWLAFKVAVEWKRGWNADGNSSEDAMEARARFNLFVLGTALSLLVTVVIVLLLADSLIIYQKQFSF